MGSRRPSRKRPCRICRKWFTPHPRVGDRQQTCGAPDCQQEWHRRKCAAWNRTNRTYFQEIYLRRRLEEVVDSAPANSPASTGSAPPPPSAPAPATPRHYPKAVIQEVIGAQHLVIIEYIVRLLVRGVQEVIAAQLADSPKESRQLPPRWCSRGDGPQPPSQVCSGTGLSPPPGGLP